MEFQQNIADGLLFHNVCIEVTEKNKNLFGQFIHKDTKSPLCCHVVPLHDMTTYLTEQRKFGHWICKHCDPLFVNLLQFRVSVSDPILSVLEFTTSFKSMLLSVKEHVDYKLIQGNLGDKRKLENSEDEDLSVKRVRKTLKEEEEEEDREAIETLLSNIDSNPVSFFHYVIDRPDTAKDFNYGAGLMDDEKVQFDTLEWQRSSKIEKDFDFYRDHRVLSYIEKERKELKESKDRLEDTTDLVNDLNWKILSSNTQMSRILEDNDPEECEDSFYNSLLYMPMMVLLSTPRTNNIEVDCLMLLSALYPYFFPPSIRKYRHLKNLINTRDEKIVSNWRLLYALQSPEMEYMVYRKYLKMDPPSLIELRQNLQPSIQITTETSTNMPGHSRKEPNYTLQLNSMGSAYIKSYGALSFSSKKEGLEGKYNVDFHGDVLYYASKGVNDFILKKWMENTTNRNIAKTLKLNTVIKKNSDYVASMTDEKVHKANRMFYNWYKELSYTYERNQEMINGESQILELREYDNAKRDDTPKEDTMLVFDIRINREWTNLYGNTTSILTEDIEEYKTEPILTFSVPIHDIDIKKYNILKIDVRSPQEELFKHLYLTFPKDQFNDKDVSEALQRQDNLETMIEKKLIKNNFRTIQELCLVGMHNIDLTNHGLDQIREFDNLETLSLFDSYIMTIPPYLRDMKSLKNLYIQRGPKEDGKFAQNDSFYGLLPNIEFIMLSHIQCSPLFNHLIPLHSIEESRLRSLRIEKGHKRVFLNYHNLEHSPLVEPLSEPNSRQRRKLVLKKNILMRWNVIGNITNLSLTNCNLEFIPYVVGTLKKLSHLDLARNKLQTWVEITNARHTDKGGMYIGFLRHNLNVISELPLLEFLDLSDNGLEVMPFGLLTVNKRIKLINLTRNPINVCNLGSPKHKYFDRDILGPYFKRGSIDLRFETDPEVDTLIEEMSIIRYKQLYAMATTFEMDLLKQPDVKDIRCQVGDEFFSGYSVYLKQIDYNYTGKLLIRRGGEHSVNVDNLPDATQTKFQALISYGTAEEKYDSKKFSSSGEEYPSTISKSFTGGENPTPELSSIIYSQQAGIDISDDQLQYPHRGFDLVFNWPDDKIEHIEVDDQTVIDMEQRKKTMDKLAETSGYQQSTLLDKKEENHPSRSTKQFYCKPYELELPVLSSRVQGELAFETINVKQFVDRVVDTDQFRMDRLRHY